MKRAKWREFKGKDKQLFNTIQPELWAFVDQELWEIVWQVRVQYVYGVEPGDGIAII